MARQIYEVLSGFPFGRGGPSTTLTSDPCARARVSGTGGTNTLSVDQLQGTFNNGDLVLIHQTRGNSTPGQWEVNQIITGAGTGTFTLKNNLDRTYTSNTGVSNSEQAQIVKIVEYEDLVINTFTAEPWRTSENYNSFCRGGVMAVAASGRLTFGGTANLNGRNGWSTGSDHNGQSFDAFMQDHAGGGFRGGTNTTDGNHSGVGEGYNGNYLVEQGNSYANGGRGTSGNHSGTEMSGKNHCSTDLLTATFGGGAGGGHGNNGNDYSSSGANGGGLFFIWARYFDSTSGGLSVNGGQTAGAWSNQGLAGNGAAGGILVNTESGILTTGIQALGGSQVGDKGPGDNGKIRINYGRTISGDTNPTSSKTIDSNLVDRRAGSFCL